ncbi:MAG TPA: PAS domain S-box protein, partial [Opitutaceae bacterium]
RDGRFRFVNKAFADRWQTAPQEFIGKTIAEVAGPQALAAAQPFIDRVLAGETVTLEREIEYRDLGVRYMKGTYTPEYDADGNVCGWLSAATDLTERWQAEQALRQSEARLRLATRSGKVGLWEWDVPGNRVTWTDSLFEIHGVKREEFPGTAEAFVALIHPEDRAPVERALRSSLEHDLPYELEFRAVRPGGATIWLYTNAIVVREGGRPAWMLGATFDITARKQAELGLRESEARFRALTKHAPVGIFLTDTGGEPVFVNDKVRELSGLAIEEMRGRRWTLAVHPDDRERVAGEWHGAVTRNEPFNTEYRFQRPEGGMSWVQASAIEHRNAGGALVGYIGTLVDLTERKKAEAALRETEKRFRTLASHAPVGIFLTDPQGDTIFVNESWCAMTGLSLAEAGGGGWARAIHPDDRARVAAGWAEALAQNRPSAAEYRFLRADGTVTWVQGHAVQLRDAGGNLVGYIGTVADFTGRKATEERLREREAELSLIATHAPIILAHCDAEQRFLFVNRAYAERFGLAVEDVIGRTVREVLGEVVHARLAPYIARVLQGETFSFEDEIPYEKIGLRFMRAAYTPDLAEDGSVRGYLCAITDLSDRRAMEEELRRRTRSLEILNRVASQLAAERDLEKVVQSVTDAGRELSGAAFGAFFYNVTDAAGDSYTLYTISGVPREAFSKFPMPRATQLFGPTFRGEGPVRIGDVRRDERYGKNPPHHGMPAGHMPVSSYLAVPVISRSGEVLGGLFFGHPEPDRFTEEAERTVSNLAAQAAIAIDNANLYLALERELREKTQAEEGLRQAQQELLAHAGELERRVEVRTASLREAIAQMEEFSYSVSHDLRAPLRAMNAYAQALIEDYGAQLDDTARNYLDRIQRSSVRMEKLTHDVLSYSRVARAEIELAEVDLTRIAHDIVAHYRELQEPAARVTVHAPLPRVRAHESSLGQALANLLTNGVTFVAPGVMPEIDVRAEVMGERVRIWIQDNGIGIAPEHQERLFQVFERVPTRNSYEGTGIGLAIVRKAVEKMGGTCGVVSDGSNGSRFWIELSKA